MQQAGVYFIIFVMLLFLFIYYNFLNTVSIQLFWSLKYSMIILIFVHQPIRLFLLKKSVEGFYFYVKHYIIWFLCIKKMQVTNRFMYLSDVKLYLKTTNSEEFFSKPRYFQNDLVKIILASNPREGSQLLNKLKKTSKLCFNFQTLIYKHFFAIMTKEKRYQTKFKMRPHKVFFQTDPAIQKIGLLGVQQSVN